MKIDTLPMSLSIIKNFPRFKDEHFSCLHSSCQWGLKPQNLWIAPSNKHGAKLLAMKLMVIYDKFYKLHFCYCDQIRNNLIFIWSIKTQFVHQTYYHHKKRQSSLDFFSKYLKSYEGWFNFLCRQYLLILNHNKPKASRNIPKIVPHPRIKAAHFPIPFRQHKSSGFFEHWDVTA